MKIKIDKILKSKNLNRHKLSKLFGCSENNLSQMVKGKRPFSPSVKEKLLPILEVSEEEFESWVIASKYDKELIQKAVDSIKNKTDKDVDVFTQNVDSAILEKGTTRNALGASLKYDPSSVRKMISGEITRSLKVITGLSNVLEIPPEDLQAWDLADKSLLTVLELALDELEKEMNATN